MLSPKYSVKDFTKFTSKMVDGSIFDRRRFNNPLVNLRGIRNNTLIIYYSSSVLKIIEFVYKDLLNITTTCYLRLK